MNFRLEIKRFSIFSKGNTKLRNIFIQLENLREKRENWKIQKKTLTQGKKLIEEELKQKESFYTSTFEEKDTENNQLLSDVLKLREEQKDLKSRLKQIEDDRESKLFLLFLMKTFLTKFLRKFFLLLCF